MSHAPERKEKDCLNCGTIVQGRFCHVCGQENIVPKENFVSLVIHFFYDLTHFDSKFFGTLRSLVFKPGFLSKEYMAGRRNTYLHPVRMYLFTSAIFFLIFFALQNPEATLKMGVQDPLTPSQRDSILNDLQEALKTVPGDRRLKKQVEILSDTSRQITTVDLIQYTDEGPINLSGKGHKFKTFREYDSVQMRLQRTNRDGWLTRRLIKTEIKINEDYRKNPSGTMAGILNTFLHRLPYLLFVSLPFFALILKLLYVRRKDFFYADHIIFTLHHYIFSFLLFLIVFGLSEMQKQTGWGVWKTLMTIFIMLIWPGHLYIAMKKFYRQGWLKTFFKFLLLNFMGLIVLVLLFVIFFVFSVIQL